MEDDGKDNPIVEVSKVWNEMVIRVECRRTGGISAYQSIYRSKMTENTGTGQRRTGIVEEEWTRQRERMKSF